MSTTMSNSIKVNPPVARSLRLRRLLDIRCGISYTFGSYVRFLIAPRPVHPRRGIG